VKSTPQLIAQIIQTVLGLAQGRVWVQNQKGTMPTDPGLVVVVGLIHARPFASQLKNRGTETETRHVSVQETISLDIRSANNEALLRLPEVISALHSTYALQVSEKYALKIAQVPTSAPNTSEADGSSMLTRFTVTTIVQRTYDYSSAIEYFDTFDPPTIVTEDD
jgi:hypothetical protein